MKQIIVATIIALAVLSAGAQIKVACIGNSITQGAGLSNPASQAYPAKLQALLGSGYTVQNDGISGTTMLKNGDDPYWKHEKLAAVFSFKPGIITIKLGTNDTKPQNWDAHNGEFKRDYLSMIDTLNTLSTKPRIFLVLPVPIWSNSYGIRDSALKKIVVIVKQIANERGLPMIDCNTPLLPFQSYFSDGVHPNAVGADSIARIISRSITYNEPLIARCLFKQKKQPPVAVNGGNGFASRVGDGAAFVSVVTFDRIANLTGFTVSSDKYKVRIFDLKGSLVKHAVIDGASDAPASVQCMLRTAPGIRWFSVQKNK